MPRRKKNKKIADKENRKIKSPEETKDEDLYETKVSDKMGRYLVAKREISKGTVIFDEEPLVVGPCQDTSPLCLGCYKQIDDINSCLRCKICKWPICSFQCHGFHSIIGHSKEECEILSRNPSPTVDNLIINKFYNAIVPLRCLLLKDKSPEKWNKLSSMESHNAIRKNIPIVWETNQKFVVDTIRKLWKLVQFSEDEIHSVCGYLEVNAFEVGQNNISIRALYDKIYLIAHDCVPNTTHNENAQYNLKVRASVEIKEGAPITLSYAHTLLGTLKRREHLKASKFFDCNCDRCTNPTELQTFMSAMKCPKCESGWVLSSDPLNNNAIWKCYNGNCPGYSVNVVNVILLMEKIQNVYDSINLNDINSLESFIKQYEKVLHPNHYHMLGAKYSLSQLYGKSPGYLIHELSNKLLERKRDICIQILEVFDKIEPGYSRVRGVTLYELHAPIMILTTKKNENKQINKKELKLELKRVIDCLKESTEILSYEQETSMEGMMGLAAKEALEGMKHGNNETN